MQAILLAFVFSVLTIGSAVAQSVSATPIRAVVELYTSQGCNSCPPADALLGKLSKRPDIMALSLPITYWDYLGWKDTLAKEDFTNRQTNYAYALRQGQLYTPQMVINGRAHALGSDKKAVNAVIEAVRWANKDLIPISVTLKGNRLVIEVGKGAAHQLGKEPTIWMAIVRPSVDVKITYGENRNNTITYYNVVRKLQSIGMWSGKSISRTIPARSTLRKGEKCAVFIQQDKAGPIIAAAWMAGEG